MRLNHNLFSLNIFNNYKDNVEKSEASMKKISSGVKIQGAKDNPSKISASESLKMQILSNSMVSKNIQDTASMIQTFDGSMQEINNSLVRIRELTIQANNGTLTDENKNVAQNEINAMLKNIDYLANNTQFNGINLIDSENEAVTGLIGRLEGENIEIPKFDCTIKSLFPNGLDATTMDGASKALHDIDHADNKVALARSTYGSIQSRLESTIENVEQLNISLQKSQSNIGDTDIAEEMMKYTTKEIISQAAIALMAQSNNLPQDTLKRLENIR